MKTLITIGSFCICLMFLSPSQAKTPLDTSLGTDLTMFSQEIEVSSNAPAKELFHGITREAREASLVHGLFFKNDRFMFCEKEGKTYRCSVYLKMNGLGELSEYDTDPDYGKGDVINALFEKPVIGKGSLIPTGHGLKVEVQQKLAHFLYKKMKQVYIDYDESDDSIIEVKQGKNVFCAKVTAKDSRKAEYKCSVKIQLNGGQSDEYVKPDLT